ncbi:hypothetical protein H4R20_004769 [Coemansia guatemalensis]|uniref:Phosphatidylinositol N-acetylglucosaminyltransferase subunit H conserved domain-containing protein n=1 Tax=Coemansia guatemalensis TaxID=2761395 RepID=A0A9W8LQ79_9FUNG|nr:hypothetical protein H4R20_004769 [Coemansia guatemalensis]
MRRLRRVISKQSTNTPGSPLATEVNASATTGEQQQEELRAGQGDSRETASFLGIERWPILGRSSQRRREVDTAAPPIESSPPVARVRHRPSQSVSIPSTAHAPARDWRLLRDGGKHKRTSSSSSVTSSRLLPFAAGIFSSAKSKQAASAASQHGHTSQRHLAGHGLGISHTPHSHGLSHFLHRSPGGDIAESGFIGYPPGGLEIQSNGLLLVCEQKSPDVCEFTVRHESAGLRISDMLAIALVSWAAHIFFCGHILFALLPMALYLIRASLQVYKESLIVIRSVGIQTETVTLAGFRSVRSYELQQIKDLFIHEALQLFEYRYYMAILPRDPHHRIVIMFPHLLPKLDKLLPVYHGARRLLFSQHS